MGFKTELEIAKENVRILDSIGKDMEKSDDPQILTKYSTVVIESCNSHKQTLQRFLVWIFDYYELQQAVEDMDALEEEVEPDLFEKITDLRNAIKEYEENGI